MYTKQILIRFGDMMLKGKNQIVFRKKAYELVKNKLSDVNVEIIKSHDHLFIDILDTNENEVIKRLLYVSGLQSFSICYVTSNDIDDILQTSINLLSDRLKSFDDFKISTKRTNKQFPYTSLDFSKFIAPKILSNFNGSLKVNVKKPKNTLTIEIRDKTYIYLDNIKGLGGFPSNTGGKALSMISGGIDSPVSSFLAINKGLCLDLIHFESTPLTALESVDKVISLSQKLSKYLKNNKINLYVVSIKDLHEAILNNIPDSYIITILRRSMYRIADMFAQNNKYLAIVNGESIGQVASQTLESIYTVSDVCKTPIIRPLATYDKNDIIEISKKIDTYDISILPFEDCCTIYLPKSPSTKPNVKNAEFYESKFDILKLEKEAYDNITKIVVSSDKNLKLSNYGLTLKDALEQYDRENNINE